MIRVIAVIGLIDDRYESTIHFCRNPVIGGRPASERRTSGIKICSVDLEDTEAICEFRLVDTEDKYMNNGVMISVYREK